MSEQAKCDLCGEPMPPGEEMFKFHGYSGDCPKPAAIGGNSTQLGDKTTNLRHDAEHYLSRRGYLATEPAALDAGERVCRAFLSRPDPRMEEAVALLRELEWSADEYFAGGFCPVCEMSKHQGHKPDCKLARFLERHGSKR